MNIVIRPLRQTVYSASRNQILVGLFCQQSLVVNGQRQGTRRLDMHRLDIFPFLWKM